RISQTSGMSGHSRHRRLSQERVDRPVRGVEKRSEHTRPPVVVSGTTRAHFHRPSVECSGRTHWRDCESDDCVTLGYCILNLR
ncbi:hypothetical protein PROFUN_15693, partial [Planoprotostelium fungivorum]